MFFSLLYIGVGLLILWFSDVYVVELLVSFLPYLLWWWVVLVVYLGIQMLMLRLWLRKKWLIVMLVTCSIFVASYAWEYVWFYSAHSQAEWESGLSILYGNIRYKNDRMDELVDIIDQYSPDLLFFVEYTQDHHSYLYPVLSEAYPYINTEYPQSVGPAGKVMYSKYPFENLAPTLEVSAQWRYGYMAMEFGWHEYVFYLVHTSAPISPLFFRMRNAQLDSLQDAVEYDMREIHKESVMTVLWDFNVSPWSSTYDELASSFSLFTNVSSFFPGVTTWWYRWSVIRSHIDHIWINNSQLVKALDLIPLQWSDHDLLYMELYKK